MRESSRAERAVMGRTDANRTDPRDYQVAKLPDDELRRIRELEERLGVVLIAYERR